jgi:hypothetical protein
MRGTVNGTVYFDRNRNGMREPNEPGMPGWQVEYAGVRAQQSRTQPTSGTLTTDSIGDFKTWLPADPAYGDPTYTISARSATNASWTRIENGTAYWEGGTIAMTNRTYTVRLQDRADVTYLNFGNVCTVKNTGGTAASHWLGDGRSALSSNDQPPIDPATRGGRGGRGGRGRGGAAAGWRNLLNNTPFLVNADGSRFQVTAGTFDEAYAPFRTWLSGGTGQNTSYLASIQLATTTLNVTWGTQDGNATVHDPVANDWTSISALLGRVSTFIEAHPNTSQPSADRTTAEAYRKLLEELNTNAATVTPASPSSCARPF